MRSQKICSTQSTAVGGARTEEKEREVAGSGSIHQTSWVRFIFLNYILSSIIDLT